jgi:hypothetical protein
MEERVMVASAVRFFGAVALAVALWISAGCGSGAEKSARNYIAALQRYDIEALRGMISPDVIVTSGRSGAKGPDQLLAAADFQAGIRTTYECTNMAVRGDTVDVNLIERSELGTLLGIPETHHYERLVFVDGMLKLRELRKPTEEQQAFGQKIRELKTWINMTHPEAAGQIDNPMSDFKGNRETGELLLKMAREWRQTQPAE